MESQDIDSAVKGKIHCYITKLTKPDPDDDFLEVLENLNALLISTNYRVVRDVASQLDLSQLFHQFNTTSQELFCDQLVSVFNQFLEALPINEIFIKYYNDILEGLYSSNIFVVEIWIKKVVKTIFSNEGLLKNVSNSSINIIPMLKCVIRLIPSESTLVASAAHDICVSASKTYRLEFFSPGIQEELKKLKEPSKINSKVDKDTINIRFSEICVDIACINQLLLDLLNNNGFLLDIASQFENKLSNDPLVALNMIKLMTDLASKPHGLDFLKKSTSILQSISHKIEEYTVDDMFGALMLPGLINFYIRIAEFDLNILNQFPMVIKKIISFIENKPNNSEFFVLGIDSIAYLCRKNEGKLFIADKMDLVLDHIASTLNTGQTNLKCQTLAALNQIMEVHGADPGNNANLLTENWYSKLDSLNCGIEKFMKMAQEPFLDLRVPAINFIRILATTVWGQKILANETNFLDYLLDRTTETTKEGREAKFEIVRELTMSPFIRLSFAPESILRIRGYFKSGPVDREANVAFENA